MGIRTWVERRDLRFKVGRITTGLSALLLWILGVNWEEGGGGEL